MLSAAAINSLATTMSLWEPILPHLKGGLRIIRYDMRGHGDTEVPPAPYSMGTLVKDAEALLDHLQIKDALVVGLSIGGMVAQGLAVKRLDLVRAMVLSNTAAKIGSPKMWDERIETVKTKGLATMADARWPAQVGVPNWSATTRSVGFACASRRIVRTKLAPELLKTQLVRRITCWLQIALTFCSPASLLRP